MNKQNKEWQKAHYKAQETVDKGMLHAAIGVLAAIALSFGAVKLGAFKEYSPEPTIKYTTATAGRNIGYGTLHDEDFDGKWDRLYLPGFSTPGSRRQIYVKEGYSSGISQSLPEHEVIDVHVVKPDYFDEFNKRYPQNK